MKKRSKDNLSSGQTLSQSKMVWTAYNYKWIAIGLGLIVLGFAIMAIENTWNGFWSLYPAPVLILAGFFGIGWAVMAKEAESRPE